MKEDIAKRWIAALRSGKYKQTVEQLQKSTHGYETEDCGFCCLGVLCDLAVDDGVDKWDTNSLSMADCVIPDHILKWSGLRTADGVVPGIKENLWQMNDNMRKSFSEIAAVIEKNWEAI